MPFLRCNILQTVFSDVAVDFDTETNGVSAAQVTSTASKPKYSWLSDELGANKRSVDQRTRNTRKLFNTLLNAYDYCTAMSSVFVHSLQGHLSDCQLVSSWVFLTAQTKRSVC